MDNFLGRNDEKMRCKGVLHIVEPGDTLYRIGKKYGTKVSRIMYANPYVDVYNLQIGDEICVPVMIPRTEEEDADRKDCKKDREENRMENENAGMPAGRRRDEDTDMPAGEGHMRNGSMPVAEDESRPGRDSVMVPGNNNGTENREIFMPAGERRMGDRNMGMPVQETDRMDGKAGMPEREKRMMDEKTVMPVQENHVRGVKTVMPVQDRMPEAGNAVMPVQDHMPEAGNAVMPVQQNPMGDRNTAMPVQEDYNRGRMTARYEKRMDESVMLTRENGANSMGEPVCRAMPGTKPCRRQMSSENRNFSGMEPFMEGGKPPMMGFCANRPCEKMAAPIPWESEPVSENMVEKYLAVDPQQNSAR